MTHDLPSPISDPTRLRAVQEAHRAEQASGRTLDHLALLASDVLNAPAALISMVDGDRERLEGSTGLPETWVSEGSFPLDYSFCAHLVGTGEPLLVEDARRDERVQGNPAIEEMHVISYAGVPLRTQAGQVLGAVCVIDHQPRAWTESEVHVLTRIADAAREEIEQSLVLYRERTEREEAANRFRDELADVSRFRILVENSLAGIYLVRGDRILYANPRLREIFGFAPGETLSELRVGDLVVEEDRARVLENIRRRMAGEEQREHYGFRARRRDEEIVDVEVLGSRIEVEGAPAVVGTLLDVTEQKRAEEQLRKAADRLRVVERATEDVIWEWDVGTGQVRWSEAGAKMFRYRPEEVGSTIDWHLEHIHPADRERMVRNLETALNGSGEFWSEEYRFRRGDERYVTVLDRGYVRRDERSEAVCVTGVMMDITERKREEEAQRFLLEASALLDSSLDAESVVTSLARLCVPRVADYCMIDLVEESGAVRRAAVTHVDPSREALLLPGAAGEERRVPKQAAVTTVLRQGEHLFIPECDDARLEVLGFPDRVREAILGRERSSLIMVLLSVGEQHVGALTLGTLTPARQFTPLDLMFAESLAHRVALAVDRARLYAQAQAAIRARDEVLGMVSHDLRNPLNTIQLTATLLQDLGQEKRSDNQRWLEKITRSAEQMSTMISDLVDVASIEAGGFSVEPSERRVDSLLEEACALLEPLTGEKGVHLETRVAEDLPPVQFDAPQMLRVISNLAGNAIKFTPPGGRVVLGAERDGEEVRFSVTDTGPGIPEEQLSHVFDRFWQARPGDRRGAGLGLTIARGIVEAHGGRIWAESTPGKGATFTFSLPIARRE